jgi:hypothetical protein
MADWLKTMDAEQVLCRVSVGMLDRSCRKIRDLTKEIKSPTLTPQQTKIHRTLRVSPAMAAGVSKRLMDVSDLVNLLIESEAKKAA